MVCGRSTTWTKACCQVAGAKSQATWLWESAKEDDRTHLLLQICCCWCPSPGLDRQSANASEIVVSLLFWLGAGFVLIPLVPICWALLLKNAPSPDASSQSPCKEAWIHFFSSLLLGVHDPAPASLLDASAVQVRLLPKQPCCGLAAAQEGACTPASSLRSAVPWMVCRGSLNAQLCSNFSWWSSGGPVPSLLRAVESLLQNQDESSSVDMSSGTCHSGIRVFPSPLWLCPPLAPLRCQEEIVFLFHRGKTAECRERSPTIYVVDLI